MDTESQSWLERLADDHPQQALAMEELRARLVRGLRSGLSGRAAADDHLIEDAVQGAMVKVWERLATYQGRGKFVSWALAIAFRVAFNELRRREWKHVSLQTLRRDAADELVDPQRGPDVVADRHQVAEQLRSVIHSALTARQRDVLLCELNGMPQEEIARQLGTNRNNVYKLFHDARKALKRALEERGFEWTRDESPA